MSETPRVRQRSSPPASDSLPLFDPDDRRLLEDPHPLLRRHREREPVHWGRSLTPLLEGQWWIFRHADAAAVLTDPRFGRDAAAMRRRARVPPVPEPLRPVVELTDRWMLQHDGDEHHRLRGIANRAFTPRMASRLRPRMEALADELLAGIPAGQEFELVRAFARPFSVRVIAELLGVPAIHLERLAGWLRSLPAILAGSRRPDAVRAAAKAVLEMREFFVELLAARRSHPEEDLLTAMAGAEDDGERLSDDEVVATAVLLLGAGHVTTVHLVANAIHALLAQPDALATLRYAPDAVEPAVDELVRFAGPTQWLVRYCFEPAEIAGRSLRPGQLVGVVVASANRDPAVFAEPDRIDPVRDARAHLGFGRGPHFCLGASLARLETAVALAAILERFPALGSGTQAPRWQRSFGRGLAALWLRAG